MPDKKLAEFNFKVMQYILICGHYLSKWQDSVNENCEICNTVHDIPHLLFDCDLAQYIWKKAGKALNSLPDSVHSKSHTRLPTLILLVQLNLYSKQ